MSWIKDPECRQKPLFVLRLGCYRIFITTCYLSKVNPPKTIKECSSYCGMVNYMSMFLPSLQEKLIPIYFITRKGIPFHWGEEQQKAL